VSDKTYTIDLAESFGFGEEFAMGSIIELLVKHRKPDHVPVRDLSKAAWYLSRLIGIELGRDAQLEALESFKNGLIT